MKDDKNRTDKNRRTGNDANPDPITGAPGSHPVGTAAGATGGAAAGVAAGAAAGAAAGTPIGGPVGAAVGGAVGAIAGAVAGKAIAERVKPTEEEAYWRENYSREPYYDGNFSYEDYRGAYRTGYEGYARLSGSGKRYEEVEPELRRDYERNFAGARLPWEKARHAARAAWHRFDRDLERYVDFDVVDRNDEKIGKLECLWSDHTGEPAFLGVRTGWIFGKTHVVPAEKAHVSEATCKIRLPYAKEMAKEAPSFDPDVELTEEQERQVYSYYGLPVRGTPPPKPAEARRPVEPPQQRATPEQATIQLSEEEVKIGKRQVEVGGVRLRKIIRTEVINQPVQVEREEIVIERVPAEQAHAGRQKAFKEQEVYIPLRREEVVVEKQPRLREEVRARKKKQKDQQQVSEQVRREDIEIEETGEARRGGSKQPRPVEGMRECEEQPRSQRRHEED